MCLRHYINCIQVESSSKKKKTDSTVGQNCQHRLFLDFVVSYSKIKGQCSILPWTGSICYLNVWNEYEHGLQLSKKKKSLLFYVLRLKRQRKIKLQKTRVRNEIFM